MTIKKTAVLGAGVMGAQIAGHLAGCGIDVLLMDIVPPQPEILNPKSEIRNKSQISNSKLQTRNTLALQGIERLRKSKPSAMYDLDDLRLITPGNFEDDMSKIADCDLIIEAVVERLDIKRKIFTEVEKYLKPDTIISSNTSGILLRQLVEGRSPDFKKRFFITHFFNPVRYMKLVELIKGPDVDLKLFSILEKFLEDVLGKGVVYAKDTPNFIANRIGVYSVLAAFKMVEEKNIPIEFIDKVMGPPTCRPRSAIFRTADIVGIDTLALVAKNSGLEVPDFVKEMIKRGWVGEKAGQGFYKKAVSGERGASRQDSGQSPKGGFEILVLDPKTMEYRVQQKLKTPSLGKAREISDSAERLRTVVLADDEAGKIARPLVEDSIDYAAKVLDEIADSSEEVDKAMRWGFNWELGPFEQGRALGVEEVEQRLKSNIAVSRERLAVSKKQKKVVATNAGADLVDLGDGVFSCQFHTKMNAIDGDVIEMLNRSLDLVEKEGLGLLIGNEGVNFSAGANLMLIFLAASNGAWGEIDKMVRAFQDVSQRIRFFKKPVVVAPFGLAIGGGCEISMAASKMCMAAETYMGLVEVGVGLIPAGGGCKNLILKMEERHKNSFDSKNNIWFAPNDGGPFPKSRDAFQTIAFAKVSTSAKDAIKLGYAKRSDSITLDKDKLIENAKNEIIKTSSKYAPPLKCDEIVLPGNGGKQALVNGIRQAKLTGQITEHDVVIGEKLAHVLTGGDMASTHKTNEDHVLDLEREAFLSLCGMEKTVARIQHMLQTGKPLRN